MRKTDVKRVRNVFKDVASTHKKYDMADENKYITKGASRIDANGDGATYWLRLEKGHNGDAVRTGFYVCVVNDIDYDFFVCAEVVVNLAMRRMFLRSADVWWKNGEWNAVRLNRGGMASLKFLLNTGFVEKSIVCGGGDEIMSELVGEKGEGWQVHIGYRATHARSMKRWMKRRGLEGAGNIIKRKNGWGERELEEIGNQIIVDGH